mmetsp:Transcript_21076/g.32236  ORF Transcript_21076/g.32236 Transcript_21076/m.32236 type:complete len:119 (+) Transcript_21076:135-491(+)
MGLFPHRGVVQSLKHLPSLEHLIRPEHGTVAYMFLGFRQSLRFWHNPLSRQIPREQYCSNPQSSVLQHLLLPFCNRLFMNSGTLASFLQTTAMGLSDAKRPTRSTTLVAFVMIQNTIL